jgi:hypothetical protein
MPVSHDNDNNNNNKYAQRKKTPVEDENIATRLGEQMNT